MIVNTFSVATLILAGMAGAAAAAPLPANSGTVASIQGHDVYSRFLPGAYIDAPGATDGGSIVPNNNAAQNAPLSAPVVDNNAVVTSPSTQSRSFAASSPVLTPSSQANTSDVDATDSTGLGLDGKGSDGGSTLQNGGGSGGGSPTHVGTVPLPPALPLFGAAVLALAAFGWSRKGRPAKA